MVKAESFVDVLSLGAFKMDDKTTFAVIRSSENLTFWLVV
jgi:hypothetical protein